MWDFEDHIKTHASYISFARQDLPIRTRSPNSSVQPEFLNPMFYIKIKHWRGFGRVWEWFWDGFGGFFCGGGGEGFFEGYLEGNLLYPMKTHIKAL